MMGFECSRILGRVDLESVRWRCTPHAFCQEADLSRWAARNEAQARDKENLLFERSKFQIFPRAEAQFRPSGVSLDLWFFGSSQRTITWDHAHHLGSQEHKPR